MLKCELHGRLGKVAIFSAMVFASAFAAATPKVQAVDFGDVVSQSSLLLQERSVSRDRIPRPYQGTVNPFSSAVTPGNQSQPAFFSPSAVSTMPSLLPWWAVAEIVIQSAAAANAPVLTVAKTIAGRVASSDQFSVAISNGGPSATSTGAANSVTTTAHMAIAGTAYTLSESAAGTANLAYYISTYQCANAGTGGTVVPPGSGTSVTIAPAAGDNITCTFTNAPRVAAALSLLDDDDDVPNAPIAVTATASAGLGKIQVSWTLNIADFPPTHLIIQRAMSPSGPWVALNANYTPATSGGFIDTVTSAGTYYYQVAACAGTDNAQCSAFTTSGGLSMPLNSPSSVTATASTSTQGSLQVNWLIGNAGIAPTHLIIQRATSSGGPWASLNASYTPATSGGFVDAVTVAGTYYYQVAACSGTDNTQCSAFVMSGGVAMPLNPPSSVSVTASTSTPGSLQIGWVIGNAGIAPTHLIIQRVANPGGTTTLNGYYQPASSGEFTDTVATSATYTYQVATCTGTDNTQCSAFTTSAPVTVTMPPNAPVAVNATSPNSANISVSWTLSSTGTTPAFLQIQRRTGANGQWVALNNRYTPAVSGSVIDVVTANGSNFYRVATCVDPAPNWCSAFITSNAVTITSFVAPPPAMPPGAGTVNDLPAHDPTVGTMTGQAGTDGGAAQYRVPIVIPPGRTGMQPDLALVYNSRSGNGVMGIGWSISGLSSIHRCPQTPEQDGQTLGVNYSGSDRLCLDGQRLVPVQVTSGLSGATEYRTEVDSYTRITQVGGDIGSGDAVCFRVEQKNGRVLHYGGVVNGSGCSITASAHSRVVPGGAPRASSWLVEKIEDRVGNNQLYAYQDVGNGEVLLRTVSYTGFGAVSGDRTVTFAYEARSTAAGAATDVSSSYLAGGLTMQTQALQSITTAVAGATVRMYTPSYVASSYTQRLMMVSLTECAYNSGQTSCHPATQFAYNDDVLNQAQNFPFQALNNVNTALSGKSLAATDVHPIGDVDGDGAREMAIGASSLIDSGAHSFLGQISADGTVQGVVDLTGTSFVSEGEYWADIDGDGRAKLITSTQDGQHLAFAVSKLARGAVAALAPGISASSTPAQNFAALFNTVATNIPYRAGNVYARDMNGDGKLDIVVVTNEASCNTGGSTQAKGVFVYLNNMTGPLAPGQTAQFTLPSGPLFCLPYVPTNPSTITGADHYELDHIADFDGDGLPDFYITHLYEPIPATGSYTRFDSVRRTHVASNGMLGVTTLDCTGVGLTDAECQHLLTDGTSDAHYWLDVNGDGLEDYVRAKGGNWKVRLNQGGVLGPAIDTQSQAGLDLSGGGYRYANKAPVVDVDGDGKPDLLTPSPNRGFALKMCTAWIVPPLSQQEGCPGASIGTPTAALALQSALQKCLAYACPENPGSNTITLPANGDYPNGDGRGYPYAWPSEKGGAIPATGLYTSARFAGVPPDFSSYHMDMLKFVQTGPTSIRVQVVPTPIVSRLASNSSFSAGQATDLAGNGLASILSSIGCAKDQIAIPYTTQNDHWTYFAGCALVDGSYGPGTLPDGTSTAQFRPGITPDGLATDPTPPKNWTTKLYSSLNQGVARPSNSATYDLPSDLTASCASASWVLPGLLNSATDGLNDQARWDYLTLAQARLCTRDGVAGYTTFGANGQDQYYGDARHYYFASSMPVVSAMTQSNGVGGMTGSRSAVYGYSQAMYHHLGRGFQGFRSITTENASSDASRRLITTTTFKQKFPLVGKVEQATTRTSGGSSRIIHAESSTYMCIQADGSLAACPQSDSVNSPLPIPTANTVQHPVASAQSSNDYDLGTGAASSHTAASSMSWDIYANPLAQTLTRYDDAAGGQFVSSHTTTTTATYDYSNVSAWWIDKLASNVVQTAIAYAVAPPAGTDTGTKTLTTQYQWKPDRTPWTKTVQPGVNGQESTTTYAYPSTANYGLPAQVQITAPSLTQPRTTSFGYSSDGYFVANTTNGLNQPVYATAQARDGQAIQTIDLNGLRTNTAFDAFGRPTQVTHQTPAGANIEPPINLATTNCNGGCAGAGSDANESAAAFRTVSTQQGYPTKVTWYDGHGRPVKQAQAGFSGTSGNALQYAFSATLTDYDENGAAAMQSTPYYVGSDTPYFTAYTYDALNRPLTKLAQNSCAGGNMTTTYTYAGRQTSITASGSCPGGASNAAIRMSRSTNGLGQLMQTVDANGKTTRYWTEPQGHVAAIQDVEGNVTRAVYTALGQRTQSVDPDQGAWNFTYNALGELQTQTDARGVTTSITLRDALGRMKRREQVSPANVTGLATENLLDTWTYDPTNGIGQLGSMTRQRGTAASLDSNPMTWSESYAYDGASRPSSIATTINEAGTTLNLTSTASYDSAGRLDTQTYPSALAVKRTYTAYGQLDALTNATTGYAYWTAQGQNAWGHVTGEQYPGVITGSHADFPATGQTQTLNWVGSTSDKVVYTYDSFGNLATQQRSVGGSVNTESYAYDSLQRLTQASRSIGGAVSYSYTDNGNIRSKSDNGAALYGYPPANQRSNGCGPHAAITANGLSYACDNNGNVIGGAISASYDADNHPRSLTRGGTMGWTYSTTGSMTTEQSSRGLRYFGPNGYEQIGTGSAATQVHELGPVIVSRTGGTDQISVVLRDRLGSTINVVDNTVTATRAYDAFGAVRNGDLSNRQGGTLNLDDTIHGFTKHDHADDVQLIHMGGRVYDYLLGRFLNVDPIIQNPTSSQSLNPYSYIGNNPLSGTDPAGYATCNASEVASTSECGEKGVHTIVGEDGKKTTVIVGDKGQQVQLTDTATNKMMTATIGNGAQKIDFSSILLKNTPASEINSLSSKELGDKKTAGMLSKCTYGTCSLPSDVRPTDFNWNAARGINPALYDDEDAHFHAISFASEDGSAAYLSFRGTIPSNLTDWKTNLVQGIGLKSRAYDDAVNLGRTFSLNVGDATKLYTGHSLGGGEASLAGLAAGERTITFNSAGLSSGTLSRYKLSRDMAIGLVDAYYLRGEILSGLQDHLPIPNAVGTRHPIEPVSSTPWSPVAKHGMDSVLDAMNGGH